VPQGPAAGSPRADGAGGCPEWSTEAGKPGAGGGFHKGEGCSAQPLPYVKTRGGSEVRARDGRILSSLRRQTVGSPEHPVLGAEIACLTKNEGKNVKRFVPV